VYPESPFLGEGKKGKRPSFKPHALAIATRPPNLDCFLKCSVRFSVARTKHTATDCLNLCPKCTNTRQRVSVISKSFPGCIPRTPVSNGKGGKTTREGGIRMNGGKGMGRKDEGRRREGEEDS
jgi:hypothetical protein